MPELTVASFLLAVVLFVYAAERWYSSQQVPHMVVALGLAFLALGLAAREQLEPPDPVDPPVVAGDFGGYRPHLQGFGATTRGGRGGPICVIDRLTVDNSPVFGPTGDFADCVAPRPGCNGTWETCARVALCAVSGTIDAHGVGQITILSPFLTIACQTAPRGSEGEGAPGVGGATLDGARLLVDAPEVVIQHLRIRRPPAQLNALSVGDAGDGGPNDHVHDVIVDHVSISWANEVNNYLQAMPGSSRVLVADSLIYEGLWPNAWGGICAGIGGDATVIRTVIAHCWSRQPIWGSPARVVVANNLIYNGTDSSHAADTLPAFFGDADGDGAAASRGEAVVVHNLLLPGPDSGNVRAILGLSKKPGSVEAGSKTYLEGNQGPGVAGPTADGQWVATVCGNYGNYSNAATCGPSSNLRTDTPFAWYADLGIRPLEGNVVRPTVLAGAGARPLDRDAADARVLADLAEGDGTHFVDWNYIQTHYGGMPPIARRTRTLAIPSDPAAPGSRTLADGSRNTVLEDWLETEARRLEPAAPVRGTR